MKNDQIKHVRLRDVNFEKTLKNVKRAVSEVFEHFLYFSAGAEKKGERKADRGSGG